MKKNKILVLSDDPAIVSTLRESYDIETASSRSEVLKKVGEIPGILAVIDCDMKEVSGLALYKEIKKLSPASAVILLSSTVTVPEAVEASKLGVADFIRKPALSERLLGSIKSNLSRGEGEIRITCRPAGWLSGSGNKIRTLFKNLEFAVTERKNIIFVSEAGIDISSLVQIVRDCSGRGKKLTTIDMLVFRKESLENIFWMVLQEALASSDIIYFERFGAADEKHRASILDYIKNKALKGNLTVIAGVQQLGDSEAFVDWEKIIVPGLRERKEDIADILMACVGRYSAKYGKMIDCIGFDALKIICDYSWPGNYHELECIIENAVIASENGMITLKNLQLGSKMVYENLQSSQTENLLDFKNSVEKGLVNIFHTKTGSDEITANLLDIPRSRISEELKG
jgi:DNA-binding NtrC family response regulator